MHAAAAGKSTIGIPAKIGREFSKADKGGKLPAHKKPKLTMATRPDAKHLLGE
jgi:hypothetical protein